MWCATLVLLDVVGSGCGALRCRVHPATLQRSAPQRSTPHAVTHGLCSPEDGYSDAPNNVEAMLIINI